MREGHEKRVLRAYAIAPRKQLRDHIRQKQKAHRDVVAMRMRQIGCSTYTARNARGFRERLSFVFGVGIRCPGANSKPNIGLESSLSQMIGSNCLLRYLTSSARTCASPSAFRYGRSVVIASMVSANSTIRDASGIFSPASPSGYPLPSQFS